MYNLAAKDLYGVELIAAQAGAVHEWDTAALLGLDRTTDPRPLDQPHNPGERIGRRCNTYTLLTVALLRAVGIPARSRCGFCAYFVPGFYEDHWVAEYGDPEERRWTIVDAQLDADRCGLTSIGEHGAFWIAGNLRLDLAALNKVEMLPWDVWGLRWEPPEQPTSEMLAAFATITALTTMRRPNGKYCGVEIRLANGVDASRSANRIAAGRRSGRATTSIRSRWRTSASASADMTMAMPAVGR